MDRKIDISFECKALDEVTEKANRLVELLQEAQQIIDSLSGEGVQKRVGLHPGTATVHISPVMSGRGCKCKCNYNGNYEWH